MNKLNCFIGAICLVSLSSAVSAHDEGWNLGHGTTVGAVLGGVIGYQVDKRDGAVIGSILGAIAGSSHDHAARHNRASRYFNLAEERRIRERINQRIATETHHFAINGDDLFEPGTSKLISSADSQLSNIASTLNRYDRTLVHISGYTDSEELPYKNTVLSTGWAESVAQYLVIQGIPRSRIRTVGVGHAATNLDQDSKGSAVSNRRVEVFIEPIFSSVDR